MRRGQLELLRQNVVNILIMSEVLLLCQQFWHHLAIIAVCVTSTAGENGFLWGHCHHFDQLVTAD